MNFFNNLSGWELVLTMYILAALFGLIYRALLKKFAKNTPRGVTKNIGKPDRILRLAIGIGLFVWAVMTTWSPILLFFSGFCLFEAAFSWCGFYAALGQNTCPT